MRSTSYPVARALAVLLLTASLYACAESADMTTSANVIAPIGTAEITRHGAILASREQNTQLANLRQVTARFHDIEAAKEAGYEEQVTVCWTHSSAGAMGYHYGKGPFDAAVDLLEPELLMYEPQPGGRARLVGMEYVVPFAAWAEAGHDLNDMDDVPELLGQKFTPHDVLPIFKLHIWLWRNNPEGMFEDWNPKVSCEHAAETEVF